MTLSEVRKMKLTPARRRELQKLAAMPDSEIDYSDIPELDDDFFRNGIRNPFVRPVKQQLTVRLDATVVAWLKNQGKGYQTRMNDLLRRAMVAEVCRKNDAPVRGRK